LRTPAPLPRRGRAPGNASAATLTRPSPAEGTFEQLGADGLDAFRARVVCAAPFLQTSIGAIRSWQQIKLLSVRTHRLRRWYRDGLLCIGDATYAMSPAGAAGVNYAIADAVATANALAKPLRLNQVKTTDLRRVQRRREPPVRLAQALKRRRTTR
jgi:2-polyprenyl-6-methoxyphenol hydroxylase-like FAD-dependent oxidoreductase